MRGISATAARKARNSVAGSFNRQRVGKERAAGMAAASCFPTCRSSAPAPLDRNAQIALDWPVATAVSRSYRYSEPMHIQTARRSCRVSPPQSRHICARGARSAANRPAHWPYRSRGRHSRAKRKSHGASVQRCVAHGLVCCRGRIANAQVAQHVGRAHWQDGNKSAITPAIP